MSSPEAGRTKTAKAASKLLGVSVRRLYAMAETSPWWKPEFKTDQGWDVEAISEAQAEFLEAKPGKSPANEWQELSQKYKAQISELQLSEKLEAAEARRANILPRQVFEQFVRELTGILTAAAEQIPRRVAAKASKAVRPVIMNAAGNSPLQREFEKLLQDVGEWFKQVPEC